MKWGEPMKWVIPRMWEGGECWIIGGGPSMPRQFDIPEDVVSKVMARELPLSTYSPYLSPIHERHIIGVNAAFMLGRWVDVMIYGDGAFYWANKDALCEFPNLRISCNPNTHKGRPGVYGVKYIARNGNHAKGISKAKNMISWNKHTGGAAINLAYHFGVNRIFLLGFDMNPADRHQHWHAQYPSALKPGNKRNLPFSKHSESFPEIARDAVNLKIKIFNVNLDSAISQFPKITLEEALKMKK